MLNAKQEKNGFGLTMVIAICRNISTNTQNPRKRRPKSAKLCNRLVTTPSRDTVNRNRFYKMPTFTKSSIVRFDGLRLFASALLVAIVGVSSVFVAADYYHVSRLAIVPVWIAVVFIATAIGRGRKGDKRLKKAAVPNDFDIPFPFNDYTSANHHTAHTHGCDSPAGDPVSGVDHGCGDFSGSHHH